MKGLIGFFTLVLLVGCGGGGSMSNGSGGAAIAVCQQNNVNAKILCALQKNYLWYKDLPANINPTAYSSPEAMLEAIKAPQDRYSFITTEQEYYDRYVNATFFGYGFGNRPNEENNAYIVSYVYTDGSAAVNGLRRGDKIIEIEGVSVAEWLQRLAAGTATNDDIFGENKDGVMRQFVWQKPNGDIITADFIKGNVTTNTVLHREVRVRGDNRIGYLVFNSFIELSETELEQAFTFFKQQNVNEIVLDLRYNGGGLIRVANQLASHIAMPSVLNQTFIKYQYNDKNNNKNSTTLFSLGRGNTTLNLPRVVVLTTAGSCSSSELVINSLAPFIDVVQIGDTTCGKPVGQQPEIISGYVLFAINFQTVNALDQGAYFDGLVPNCRVDDEVVGDWGVNDDPLLAEALYYLDNEQCSAAGAAQAFTTFSAMPNQGLTPVNAPIVGLPAQFGNEH
ncbi:S41 family peptidase [Rheinheimera salexigens]|uniref:Carboxyl-terminal protease n=1 Tax=Rheinheimera salexigens TaxID=1628148 RepID=A0A1E7Q9K6_9GAMM|nr:S41 family peptidase [Rheinheimera salexigens]OEY70743.1 carboxyl-terminal protease [Rheinheimera salexigens]